MCFNESLFKNDEKCFLFHLKSSCRPENIDFFVLNLRWSRKTGLIRKIRVMSKCMMWQPGEQAITINIFPNISLSKSNKTIKLGQLKEYNKRNIFIRKLCRKWDRETSSRPFFIFWINLIWGKSNWSVGYF